MIKRKVWKNNGTGQLLITIPTNSGINEGDEVIISADVSKENTINIDEIRRIVREEIERAKTY